MNSPVVRDCALLLLRVVLGCVFVAHGVQKLVLDGMDETIGQFSAAGVPQPQLMGWLCAAGELAGGAMLIIGLLTTFAAGALLIVVAGAFYYVHMGAGFFAADGGFEFVLVLFVALVMVVVFGAGRISLDGVLSNANA